MKISRTSPRAYMASLSRNAQDAKREAVRVREKLREVEQVEWREEWLASATELLRLVFARRGYQLPDLLRVGVTRPERKKTGRCYAAEISTGGCTEIFISATLAAPDDVLMQLAVELCETMGRKLRKKCARDMGLGGGEAPAWLGGILAKLGPFPHDAMELPARAAPQSTRMLKRQCSACGFTMRAAAVWVDRPVQLRCPLPDCSGVLQ